MTLRGMMFRAATAVTMAAAMAGCASSASRMPPMGPPGAMAAPMPVQPPAQGWVDPAGYGAPAAPAPVMPVDAWATTPAAMSAPMPIADAPPPASGIAGLTERQPDLCGARNYSGSVGQPGSTIPGLGLSKTYRIVEYRGIEPQDYDPNRIVFRLDAAGTITKIDCG